MNVRHRTTIAVGGIAAGVLSGGDVARDAAAPFADTGSFRATLSGPLWNVPVRPRTRGPGTHRSRS